ncbi:hypothetical protein [Arthrobacter sp. KNU40]|uniref:hypothetical protein n=1 Tax=Arthrobacter sp. KNU40 TaxID=3447965 RepID=UPI003F638988
MISNVGKLLRNRNEVELLAAVPEADKTLMPNLLRPHGVYISPIKHVVIALILVGAMTLAITISLTVTLPQSGTSPSTISPEVSSTLFGSELSPALWHELFLVLIFAAMTTTPAIASRQWAGYENLIPHMSGSESLVSVGHRGPATVADEVLAANRWIYNSRSLRLPILLVSAWIAWVVLEAQMKSGQQLGETAGHLAGINLRNWRMADSIVGQSLYLISGIEGIYIVTLQNIVGCRIILAIFRIRKRTRFGVDLLNFDGSWGWRPMRAILGATYAEIIVHGLGLFALALTVPREDPTFLIAATPAIEWVITLPIYVIAPIWMIALGMHRYRIRERAKLDALVLTRSDSESYSLDVARRVDRLNSVPSVPFLGIPEKTLFAIAQIANFSACYGVVVALLSGWRLN